MNWRCSCLVLTSLLVLSQILIPGILGKPQPRVAVQGNRNNFIQDVNKRSRGASSPVSIEANPILSEVRPVDSSNENIKTDAGQRMWLEFEGVPPAHVPVKRNTDIVLECQAVGSPPPMIYWLKNNLPIENGAPIESEEYANRVDTLGSSGFPLFGLDKSGNYAMAKVKSKLPLYCVGPEDEAVYSCVADNDGRQLSTSTSVRVEEPEIGSDGLNEIRDECRFYRSAHPKKGRKLQPAYIHASEALHMENIGSDVILPCRVAGRPRPKVIWIDSDGQVIPDTNGKKFQIHSNGDLVIKNLSWNDMGEFTCIVKNSRGNDSAATFLYPLLSDEE